MNAETAILIRKAVDAAATASTVAVAAADAVVPNHAELFIK